MLLRPRGTTYRFLGAYLVAYVGLVGGCTERAGRERKPDVHPIASPRDAAPDRAPGVLDELPLALVPVQAETYAGIDFDRFRASPHWARLRALATRDPADEARLAEFTRRTGLDPTTDVSRIFLAFPRDARVDGAFLAVVEGRGFDERRLVSYAREVARAQREDLVFVERHGVRLWTGRVDTRLAGYFESRERFVLGGAGWAERAAEMNSTSGTGGVVARTELLHLAARIGSVATGDRPAVWFASLVPAELRRILGAGEEDDLASVMRWGSGVFLGAGLRVYLRAELTHAEAAARLAARCQAFLQALKTSPRALLLGIASHVAAITVRADGPDVELSAALDEAEVQSLIDRVVTAARARHRAIRRRRAPR